MLFSINEIMADNVNVKKYRGVLKMAESKWLLFNEAGVMAVGVAIGVLVMAIKCGCSLTSGYIVILQWLYRRLTLFWYHSDTLKCDYSRRWYVFWYCWWYSPQILHSTVTLFRVIRDYIVKADDAVDYKLHSLLMEAVVLLYCWSPLWYILIQAIHWYGSEAGMSSDVHSWWATVLGSQRLLLKYWYSEIRYYYGVLK